MKKNLFAAAGLLMLAAAGAAGAKPYCGDLNNAFGPFDYRLPNPEARALVENAHFTEEVEQGVKGSTGAIGGDLDYTLRAFPNHARALATMLMLSKRFKDGIVPGARRATECYFERAVRFQPDDGAAWALYAQYLYSTGHNERALPMMEKAVELQPDNPNINYNMGLVYAKQRQYDKALPYAQKAYAAKFPLPGLKQMLISANKWVEPPEPPELPADKEEEKAAPPETAAAPAQEAAKQ